MVHVPSQDHANLSSVCPCPVTSCVQGNHDCLAELPLGRPAWVVCMYIVCVKLPRAVGGAKGKCLVAVPRDRSPKIHQVSTEESDAPDRERPSLFGLISTKRLVRQRLRCPSEVSVCIEALERGGWRKEWMKRFLKSVRKDTHGREAHTQHTLTALREIRTNQRIEQFIYRCNGEETKVIDLESR